MSINVAIVENDEQVLSGLARQIESTKGLRCIGIYSSAVSALTDFPKILPDVILTDINLPDMNGLAFVRRIKVTRPRQTILVLTDLDDPQVVFNTLSAGASGYLLKNSSSSEQILSAVRDVYDGSSPLTGSIARQLVNVLQKAAVPGENCQGLSLRERQVLGLLARGFRYKEIAEELKISYATAHTHIRHIYKKLQVSCRTEAVTLYVHQHPNWRIQPQTRQSQRVALFEEVDIARNFADVIAG